VSSGVPQHESAEDLFEDAPCGLLTTTPDGTIGRVNRTFEHWVGTSRDELRGRRFQDLLVIGGRIYYETHIAPLLLMQGAVREVAVDLRGPDGAALPALLNAVLRRDADGRPQGIRVVVVDATDRRRYEQELVRARRQEHDIAQQLQQGLLAGELPHAQGVEVRAAYRPAESGLEVGGDWYDAFWLDDERIGLVVGDVVGRGIEAATTMGQLRSAARAFALSGASPGRLLEFVDAYARRHDVGRMATVVYAAVHVASGRMEFACAGHPPPLLLPAGGQPHFSWDGRSLPLDALRTAAPVTRTAATCHLPPGSSVLLFTDGLVERRGRPLDAGLEALRDAAARHGPGAPQRLADTLVRELHDPGHVDDVCVLAAHVGG